MTCVINRESEFDLYSIAMHLILPWCEPPLRGWLGVTHRASICLPFPWPSVALLVVSVGRLVHAYLLVNDAIITVNGSMNEFPITFIRTEDLFWIFHRYPGFLSHSLVFIQYYFNVSLWFLVVFLKHWNDPNCIENETTSSFCRISVAQHGMHDHII